MQQCQGTGSQGRKLAPFVGLLREATPLEARYLVRTGDRHLRLGSAPPPSSTHSRRCTPAAAGPARCWSAPTTSAPTSAWSPRPWWPADWRRWRGCRCGRATRCGRCSPSARDSAEVLAKLGGRCAAEYKYDGIRVQAHRTADGPLELYTRRLERMAWQFPDVVALLDEGLGPREAILEGEVVAFDPASGELRPFHEVMYRRRKYGIAEAVGDVPVSLFCFDVLSTPTAGPHPPALPAATRRGCRGHHPVGRGCGWPPPNRSTTSTAGGAVRAGRRRRLRGPAVQVAGADRRVPGRRSGLAVDQAQARLPHGADRHPRPGGGRGAVRAGPPRRHVRGAAAGRRMTRPRHVPDGLPMRHRVQRRRPGRATGSAGPLGTVASGPKVPPADSKVEPLPVLRLPEVLVAIDPGIADGVQGFWWRTPVGVITRCNSAYTGARSVTTRPASPW